MAAVSERGTGPKRAPVSRARVRRAARLAMEQVEQALADGDSKRAKELAGVLREMLSLHRELQGGEGQRVTVCFVGEAETYSG